MAAVETSEMTSGVKNRLFRTDDTLLTSLPVPLRRLAERIGTTPEGVDELIHRMVNAARVNHPLNGAVDFWKSYLEAELDKYNTATPVGVTSALHAAKGMLVNCTSA